MSNVGTTPTLPPASDEISSHTATHQWQSFEFRMRHRRAERCLLRAEMALEAARRGDPGAPRYVWLLGGHFYGDCGFAASARPGWPCRAPADPTGPRMEDFLGDRDGLGDDDS